MKETIQIIENKARGGWDARFSDPKVLELFEGDTIPTVYLLDVPKITVIVMIQGRNPDYKVF